MASATITATTADLLTADIAATPAEANTIEWRAASSATNGIPEQACEKTMAASAAPAARDRWRDWLWGFLAVLCLSQFYFVRELAAAFALFVLLFAVVAGLVVGGYMLWKSCELALARLATPRRPAPVPVLEVSPIPHDTRKPA